ncbi:MAG: hypothetical protein ACMG51_05535 [Ginsengibacter sp.]
MKSSLNQQVMEEARSWVRRLEFFIQENALLKFRLSEIVDNNENATAISLAEYFQNEMLLIDVRSKYLKRTILNFSKKVEEETLTYLPTAYNKKQNRLRENMVTFEKKFLNISNEFNSRLAKAESS